MPVEHLLKGLAIGFSIAAPVGPIGVLCIRRTLDQGRLAGLISGFGASTADSLYGAIAAFGLNALAEILIGQQVWLRLIGGSFLCILGIRTIFAGLKEGGSIRPSGSHWRDFSSTFALTLTNPLTILAFAAVFTGLGVVGTREDYLSPAITVIGVFLGSAFWWFLLSTAVSFLRSRLSQRAIRWINRASGMTITIFGLISIYNGATVYLG